MIRAILVDDEVYIRNNVREKLTKHFCKEIDIIGEASNVEDAVALINQKQPDLLFLDIQLTDGTSFDILKRLEHIDFDIIFITGFDDQAIKAIKLGALDYVLKPIDNQEFMTAVIKAIDNFKKENSLEKRVEVSSDYYQGVAKKRIVLKTLENVYIVNEDDILYCKSDGNYTTVYTNEIEKILVSKPIKKVIELLSQNTFIRCHQSYLVNKKHVKSYSKQGVLIIKSDIQIPVSSRRKEFVIENIFN
jgi:two-component system LytT family response regulator